MKYAPAIQDRRPYEKNVLEFKRHYGVAPTTVSKIWDDLCTTDIEVSKLHEKEKGQKGFRNLLMVLYFLWNYPRSRHALKVLFGACEKYASGAYFWKWAERLAGLEAKVIYFPDAMLDEPFIMSVDCREHKIWEKQHPTLNMDTTYTSRKHGKHCGLKYELGVALFSDRIVWINGPYKPTTHDITVFRFGGLKQFLLEFYPGYYCVADGGYQSSQIDETMLATPNSTDPPPLKKFKSLGRCREEDVNGRMAKFKVLSHEFEHGIEKHKICYTAVAVLVQYQLDCGEAYLTKL